ncbi:MAG TPA: hypothetical protein VJT69_03875 [Pyrinomonadaceae bacterium]|nr:hypothetical protein [Pyrinomonadaceae bacterium]
MDFVVLFTLCALFGCSVICPSVPSNESETGALKILKAGGPITVEDAPNGAILNTGGGKIHVKSARQYVKAYTGGGAIVIDAIDGSVKASTGAGNISVTMVGNAGETQRDVSIDTASGDVTLVIPDGLSLEFDVRLAHTNNTKKEFRIVSDFPLNQHESDEWSSAEGTPRKYIYGLGKIGAGRNVIKIRNINGNIYLKRAQ